jgi:hypothetical protein
VILVVVDGGAAGLASRVPELLRAPEPPNDSTCFSPECLQIELGCSVLPQFVLEPVGGVSEGTLSILRAHCPRHALPVTRSERFLAKTGHGRLKAGTAELSVNICEKVQPLLTVREELHRRRLEWNQDAYD